MRGAPTRQATMLSLSSPEQRVPSKHPLRPIKKMADDILGRMSPLFGAMYAVDGRPSIPPESLLKATLLMALYSVRSERLFCEQLDYNLMFRWFLDMSMVEESFDHSVFAKNRERLMKHETAKVFFGEVIALARGAKLISDEHFTVDGTLIEAWASLKSFKRKDAKDDRPNDGDPGNPSVDFHGEKRSNETHASTTDPESRLARKGNGKEAKLSHSAHALMENRHGLLIDFRIAEANGTAEREVAAQMLKDALRPGTRATVGGDKGYDTKNFVATCREIGVTPHVAQNISGNRGSAIDARTTRHAGYTVSQRIRKRIEEIFGWGKTTGCFRKTRYRGRERNQHAAYMLGAAYDLLRIAKLLSAAT